MYKTVSSINKKLLQGVQWDGFLEKSPPGRRRQKEKEGIGGRNCRRFRLKFLSLQTQGIGDDTKAGESHGAGS